MNNINEGQTQVYLNGQIDPQYGIDTNAPYLNNVPQQLLDLVATLYNSGGKTTTVGGKIVNVGGKNDSQVLSILVGMGTPQQLAVSAINKYKSLVSNSMTYENKQKNNNKMNFTFENLYEAIKATLEDLNRANSDNSRISYSIKDSIKILELSKKELDSIIYENHIKSLKNVEQKNESNSTINPLIKYRVAKNLHNSLSVHSWIDPVKNLVSYIGELFTSEKYKFKISEAVQRISTQNDPLSEKLKKELTDVLNESNDILVKTFENISNKNPWSKDCKTILNEMKIDESKLIDSKQIKIVKTFSPIFENANGIHFHLHGKDYVLSKNTLTETFVHEPRFRHILETIKLFKQTGSIFTLFGNNEKILEFDGSTGKIMLGDTDMTNESITELKNALMVTKFFNFRDHWKVDAVCKLVESLDMFCEMDNFTSLQSQEYAALYLTLINIQESLYINKVNGSMKLNEMIKVNNATEAVKITKDFINYDVTPILSEKLIKENNEAAIKEKNISGLNNTISFLESKRKDIENAIVAYGSTPQLMGALQIIDSEIQKKEIRLAKYYTSKSINEKDKKKQMI